MSPDRTTRRRADGRASGRPGRQEEGGGVTTSSLATAAAGPVAAAAVVLLAPASAGAYGDLVWLLALIPIFVLSYRAGWRGAGLGALLSLAVFVGAEAVGAQLLGRGVDWEFFGAATLVLVAVTLGTGALSEILQRKNTEALRMAYEDPLTELANRRLLERDAEKAIEHANRKGGHVAVLFIDLVRFKRINDQLGYEAGDRALTVVARRLIKRLRTTDTVARVGGDEFAVLLPDVDELEVIDVVKERVEEGLWDPVQLAGQTLHLGIRIGWAAFPGDGQDIDELLSAADPKKGEDRHGEPGAGPASPEFDIALEDDLERAMESGDGLTLHYQPVGSLSAEEVVGTEALLRWEHPERGLLDAAEFIQVAERIGLIQEMELRVLEEAVRQAGRRQERGDEYWTSVNLSLQSLQDEETYPYLLNLVEQSDIPPSRLVVEVTESIAARKPQSVVDGLRSLRSRGVRVAVDDFGTGHCSLAHLDEFPADILKIDRFFVDRLGRTERHERLVDSIIGLARGLRLEVVAEGVETESQQEWLREAGCELYQGYLLGRPAPASEETTATTADRSGA